VSFSNRHCQLVSFSNRHCQLVSFSWWQHGCCMTHMLWTIASVYVSLLWLLTIIFSFCICSTISYYLFLQ